MEAQIAKLENNNNEIQEKAANELKKKILAVETDTITTSIKNIAELWHARITIVKDEAKKQLLNNINEFSINETFGGQDAEVDDKFLIFGSNNDVNYTNIKINKKNSEIYHKKFKITTEDHYQKYKQQMLYEYIKFGKWLSDKTDTEEDEESIFENKDIGNVTLDDLIKIITSDEKRISFMDSNKIDSHGLKTLLMKKMKEGNDDIVATIS